ENNSVDEFGVLEVGQSFPAAKELFRVEAIAFKKRRRQNTGGAGHWELLPHPNMRDSAGLHLRRLKCIKVPDSAEAGADSRNSSPSEYVTFHRAQPTTCVPERVRRSNASPISASLPRTHEHRNRKYRKRVPCPHEKWCLRRTAAAPRGFARD